MYNDWQIYTFSALFISTVTFVGILGVLYKKKFKKSLPPSKSHQRPSKWALVGRVEKLIIYPVKSFQGVQVDEAVITTLGLKFRDNNIRDRDMMVVDKIGRSITMTTNPRMSFISVEVNQKDEITFNAPEMDPITFRYPDKTTSEEKICRVKHDRNVKALDCGDEVAEWIQTYLNKPDLRLYYHHINKTQRTFEPYMYECPDFEKSDLGAFHNETSYLMVSQESIVDLNTRLTRLSSWKNWRPTILINNVIEPFGEVNWSFVRIGNENGILKAAVPCYRCPLTTVDQDKGILPKDGEPLKTLRAMNKSDMFDDRKVGELLNNKGIMGLRLGLYLPAGEGAIIKIGDPVYAALL